MVMKHRGMDVIVLDCGVQKALSRRHQLRFVSPKTCFSQVRPHRRVGNGAHSRHCVQYISYKILRIPFQWSFMTERRFL
jgi:hypothetical protein